MASAGHQLWSMIKIIWFSKSSPLHECSALGLADIVPLMPRFSKFCSFIMLNCACLWFITREKTLLNLNPQFFAYIYYLTCNHLYDENAIGCGRRKPSSDDYLKHPVRTKACKELAQLPASMPLSSGFSLSIYIYIYRCIYVCVHWVLCPLQNEETYMWNEIQSSYRSGDIKPTQMA